MESRQRVGLIVGVAVLVVFGLGWGVWRLGTRFAELALQSQQKAEVAVNAADSMPVKKGRLFSNDEVYTFLAAAKKAELIKDPLQRCLAYPDPPNSHWSTAAVHAYCQYRTQAVMSFADIQTLIQNGQAAELDQRMAKILNAQMTQPAARGLLDRTFEQDFDGSFDIRPLLDAWKRDSPNSAFALAASGYAYEKMAYKARGAGYMSETPQSNVESMDRLLQLADTDLQQAVALNPHITPAYGAMIEAGGLSLGDVYLASAKKHALANNPADLSIYGYLLWQAQPKWGGSIKEMRDITAMAQAHAAENPLLMLELSKAPSYEKLKDCDCHTAEQLAEYPTIFDQVSSSKQLADAGTAAESSHHLELSVVYFSEALRFDPGLSDERMHRIYDLNNFDESQWAVDEATRMLQAAPNDTDLIKARAYSYESLNDYPHAVQDMQAALVINPGDGNELMALGSMYANSMHDWDKAWETDNRIVKMYPNEPYGWILRSEIQQQQPRAGLRETIDYFAAHFDNSPQAHKLLLEMRAALALQPKSLGGASVAKSMPAG